MSDVYVGNNIVGNFKPDMKIDDNIQDYILNKNNGCLNLVKGKKVIKLKALDENAHLVVTNFSDEIGELNDSIYKLEYSNEIVVIILYTYITTKKLLLQSESMYLHLRREIENKFIGEEYKNLPGLPLKRHCKIFDRHVCKQQKHIYPL